MESMKKMEGNMRMAAENVSETEHMSTTGKITDAVNEAKDYANNAFEDLQEYCRENPGKAMAIAAGVGALASLILIKAFSRKESANDQIIAGFRQKGEELWDRLKSGVEPTLNKIKGSLGT